jgi:hypothetical protein
VTLYEIDEQIAIINEQIEQYAMDNDGLIHPDLDIMLEGLQMDRGKKIGNIARLLKNVKAEQEAVNNEVKRLQQKDVALQHKVESVKNFLAYAVGKGNKFKDSVVSIYWKDTESVKVDNPENLPKEYQRIIIEAKKTELKEALKSGAIVDGVTIEKNSSMVVK